MESLKEGDNNEPQIENGLVKSEEPAPTSISLLQRVVRVEGSVLRMRAV